MGLAKAYVCEQFVQGGGESARSITGGVSFTNATTAVCNVDRYQGRVRKLPIKFNLRNNIQIIQPK